MNWEEIKEKCPKAFKQIDKWSDRHNDYYWDFIYGWVSDCNDNPYPTRDLYDFFDENGIRIALTIDNQFGYEIYTNGFDEIEHSNIGWFYHRIEAETEAFNKAFEILENKLTLT